MSDASIVICTFNRCDILSNALAYLAKEDYPRNRWELIIVDNKSTDRTRQVVKEFIRDNPEIQARYILEERQGASHARNTGMKNARFPIIIYLDDDSYPQPGWLKELVKHFDDPETVIVGGRIIPLFERPVPDWVQAGYKGYFSAFAPPAEDGAALSQKYFAVGANIAFRASALQETGGFNVNFGPHGTIKILDDETDMERRILARGGKMRYAAHAVVHHFIPASRVSTAGFLRWADGNGRTKAISHFEQGKILYKVIGRIIDLLIIGVLAPIFLITKKGRLRLLTESAKRTGYLSQAFIIMKKPT